MKKTGKSYFETFVESGRHFSQCRRIFILCLLLAGFTAATESNAQQVEVSSSVSSSSVFVGEQFTLSVEVTGSATHRVDRPNLPQVDGLSAVSSIPSTSTRFSIVNGVTTATYGYNFSLRASREGVFTIPSISVNVDGNTYSTRPVEIQVHSREQMSQQREELPEIFLQLELSNERPYVGEQVTANLVLYFRNDYDIVSYQPSAAWRTEGFWVENLNEGRANPRAETIILNGVRYRKATLMAYALFPTRAGSLRLGSYTIRANVRYSGRYDDAARRFLGGFGRSQRSVDIESEAMEIAIRALPTPQPESFTGAVGRFSVSRDFSGDEVIVGEPFEIKTRFEGTGNVALINHPKYNLPETFDRFRPQENTDIRKSENNVSGAKMFTDLIIPRRAGTYEIPETELSWFDPQQRRYITRNMPAHQVEVVRDPNQVFTHVQDARLNIRPVTGVTVWRQMADRPVLSYWWFWPVALLPFLIIGIGYVRKRYLDKLHNDAAYFRSVNAAEAALDHFKTADDHAEENHWRDAYGYLHRGIIGFITDKLNLPSSGHSDAYLISLIRENGADESLVQQLSRLLGRFATIRYAPSSNSETYAEDRKNAHAILKNLRRLF